MQKDWFVFPIREGDTAKQKWVPLVKWGTEASADPVRIMEWQKRYPSASWGIATGPSGLFVLDIDPSGLKWWAERLKDEAFAKAMASTYQVQTPRGGYHLYFKNPDGYRNSASEIAQGVDGRGVGGFVVAAGTQRKDGCYKALNDFEPIEIPESLKKLLPKPKERKPAPDLKSGEDLPRNVQWGEELLRGYVAAGDIAIEGDGGNNKTFKVACSLLDKGLSEATVLDLMAEEWNPHCQPPWDLADLARIIYNAGEYGEETKGSKGFSAGSDLFGDRLEQLKKFAEKTEKHSASKWTIEHTWDIRDTLPDPSWLVKDFLPSVGAGLIYGRSGSLKSFLALDMALSLASGKPRHWTLAPEPQDVLYFMGEGLNGMLKTRQPAWEKLNDVMERPRFYSSRQGLPSISNETAWLELKQAWEKLDIHPKLIVLDTAAVMMLGLKNSSDDDVGQATKFMLDMASLYQCCVVGIHHEGKDANKDERGSSAWRANLDFSINAIKTSTGCTLYVHKQRDFDYDRELPFHFKATKVEVDGHVSLKIERTEDVPEPQGPVKGNVKWAERTEIVARLMRLGGTATTKILAAEIADEHGIAEKTVRQAIKSSLWLNDLHTGDAWSFGGYDL